MKTSLDMGNVSYWVEFNPAVLNCDIRGIKHHFGRDFGRPDADISKRRIFYMHKKINAYVTHFFELHVYFRLSLGF